MLDWTTALTIVLMAASTYATRVVGFIVLRDRTLSPRMQAIMQNVPGCVLISVIAPAFVSSRPADLLGLAVTLVAAMRLSLLPTVVIGVVATGLLRHFVG
ncbi:Putative membrane protein [Paraburkholderia tropica]|uniref:AzlD family protein n=1 Tax=Paraburkholderia TaxID=1822464 RepID=UPI001CAD1D9A|nr:MULTISPECIES: AzlD family protein [Paraburkholderia]CAG9228701.1 Putative membrane protein [Paraburkholderia tropica]